MKRRRRRKRYLIQFLFTMVLAIISVTTVIGVITASAQMDEQEKTVRTVDKEREQNQENAAAWATIEAFAKEHNLDPEEWPEELATLLEKNPDAEEFVLQYPLKKDKDFAIDLSEHKDSLSVPLFFQWDERWGYTTYGANVMGLTGCGPTCLSMVAMYLLNDTTLTPRYVADFAQDGNYCVPGSGSAWTLMSEGGEKLGLDVTELPLDENCIVKNLEMGNPIICIMGPGEFTSSGHFIVLTGVVDGKFTINDPNSVSRSGKLWEYEEIEGQIRNLWACQKK